MTLQRRIEIVLEKDYLAGIVLCDWGSCQYTGAFNMYNALERSGMGPLHVDARYSKINTKEYVVAEFKECVQQDKQRGADKWEYFEELEEWNENKDKIKTIDDCFEWCRETSWDLWSAAPWIAEICFDNLELLNVDQAPGAGPILNLMAQGDNYETGFFCWLMKKHGFVEDDSPFDGFDT